MQNIVQIQNVSEDRLFNRFEQMIDDKLSLLFNNNSNDNLSIKEVAEELGVSELTVHNYIKRGNLKALRIGRRIFIKRSDLEDALSEVKSLKYKRL